jgi:cold shock CspA family protein
LAPATLPRRHVVSVGRVNSSSRAGRKELVHYSQIQGDGRRRLDEDEVVEFEIKEGPKGLQAVNVARQGGASAAAS